MTKVKTIIDNILDDKIQKQKEIIINKLNDILLFEINDIDEKIEKEISKIPKKLLNDIFFINRVHVFSKSVLLKLHDDIYKDENAISFLMKKIDPSDSCGALISHPLISDKVKEEFFFNNLDYFIYYNKGNDIPEAFKRNKIFVSKKIDYNLKTNMNIFDGISDYFFEDYSRIFEILSHKYLTQDFINKLKKYDFDQSKLHNLLIENIKTKVDSYSKLKILLNIIEPKYITEDIILQLKNIIPFDFFENNKKILNNKKLLKVLFLTNDEKNNDFYSLLNKELKEDVDIIKLAVIKGEKILKYNPKLIIKDEDLALLMLDYNNNISFSNLSDELKGNLNIISQMLLHAEVAKNISKEVIPKDFFEKEELANYLLVNKGNLFKYINPEIINVKTITSFIRYNNYIDLEDKYKKDVDLTITLYKNNLIENISDVDEDVFKNKKFFLELMKTKNSDEKDDYLSIYLRNEYILSVIDTQKELVKLMKDIKSLKIDIEYYEDLFKKLREKTLGNTLTEKEYFVRKKI